MLVKKKSKCNPLSNFTYIAYLLKFFNIVSCLKGVYSSILGRHHAVYTDTVLLFEALKMTNPKM